MESLSGETFDTVICGTGLSQSLLALALSRSKKRILHVDSNDFYGEHEAALSLQEADLWAHVHAAPGTAQQGDTQPTSPGNKTNNITCGNETTGRVPRGIAYITKDGYTPGPSSPIPPRIFQNAHIWKHPSAESQGLSFPRAYSLALAPQIIHTKSKLLSQLVSSRAYRQVEFLAVGSFFIYETGGTSPTLSRIPSSREDVFAAQSIPARSKRTLMKFLKFVIDYDSEEQIPIWREKANTPLSEFLVDEFKLDGKLRDCVLALTLTLDGEITVEDGLASVNRHLTSIGFFGPGFCAVYPKWGGLSEIAQVGCRAGAVGGSIYMLNRSILVQKLENNDDFSVKLSDEASVRTTAFISSQHTATSAPCDKIARLTSVINSPLQPLFETFTEGAPTPAVAVIAFPSGCLLNESQPALDVPVYAFVHSSDTGECPSGQCVVYLTMDATDPSIRAQCPRILDAALAALLRAASSTADVLYKLYYEQAMSTRHPRMGIAGSPSAEVFEFPSPSLGLAYDDSNLEWVKAAWKIVMKDEASDESFMKFEDREGAGEDDDDD